jgi:hypothetical protein
MSKQLGDLLSRMVKEQGVDMKRSGQEVAAYTAERATVLARSVGQPGYEQALEDEATNVALFAGIELLHQARAADARVVGVIQGALVIAADAAASA